MNKFNFNIPQKSLWYLLVCGGIILLFVLAGIFPLYRYNASQAKEIKNLESQLRAQGELGPIYLKLTATCLLYTSDAADDLLCVDLGGRRIIKKNK
mgnify:CR=1 FL=1